MPRPTTCCSCLPMAHCSNTTVSLCPHLAVALLWVLLAYELERHTNLVKKSFLPV